MAIPFLVFVGMCAVLMIGLVLNLLLAVLAGIAKLISIITGADEDSVFSVVIVLALIAFFVVFIITECI